MIKPIDMIVLPNDFLLQVESVNQHGLTVWNYQKVANDNRHKLKEYRPALNHWHFNDGTMTLPDGLVCICKAITKLAANITYANVVHEFHDFSIQEINAGGNEHYKITAVKILGVTAEYGPQLGMEVIEL